MLFESNVEVNIVLSIVAERQFPQILKGQEKCHDGKFENRKRVKRKIRHI